MVKQKKEKDMTLIRFRFKTQQMSKQQEYKTLDIIIMDCIRGISYL